MSLRPGIGCLALVVGLYAATVRVPNAFAQAPLSAPLSTITNLVPQFPGASPDNLAEWQKRLTLGPGDVLTIGIYRQPDLLRAGITIGPDGRLNYLQAQNVLAAGLTVDELRQKLENVFSTLYPPPSPFSAGVVILPQAYNSKKYYMLGNIARQGVYQLDRPITVIEAIARAQGFRTLANRRDTFMMADLPRSFLVRKRTTGEFERVPVDFEALFLRGDLRHNITLAPDDYLYFPPTDLPELYVLGEVISPGVVQSGPGMTVLKAIIARGGFTSRSFKSRVLIVRGSLGGPETFVVSASAMLNAKSLGFKLQSRDIVYVSRKPWYKAEELLDAAIADFLRAAVITWTGRNIGPLITEPVIK